MEREGRRFLAWFQKWCLVKRRHTRAVGGVFSRLPGAGARSRRWRSIGWRGPALCRTPDWTTGAWISQRQTSAQLGILYQWHSSGYHKIESRKTSFILHWQNTLYPCQIYQVLDQRHLVQIPPNWIIFKASFSPSNGITSKVLNVLAVANWSWEDDGVRSLP